MASEEDGSRGSSGESDIRQRVPADIWENVAPLLEGDRVKVSLASDMGLNGVFGETWLIATEKALVVVDTAMSRRDPVYVVALSDVEALRTRHLYGNALIEVSAHSRAFDLIRFTNTLSDEFMRAVRELNDLVRQVRPDARLDENLLVGTANKTASKCPKCHKALPPGLRMCPDCIDKRETLMRLLGYVKPYPRLWVLTAFLSLGFTITSLIPAWLPRHLVDEGLLKGDMRVVWTMVFALVASHAATRFLDAGRGYYLQMLGQKVLFDLRKQLYDHLQQLSSSFYDRRQTGAIMARVIGDVNQLTNFVSQGVQDILIQILTAIVIAFILLSTDLTLGLMALAPVPLVLFFTMKVNRRMRKIWHMVRRRGAELNAILGDTLPGIKVVKAFGREDDEVDRFVSKQRELYDSHMMAAELQSRAYPSIGFLMALGAAVIWAYGGSLVIRGLDTPGAAGVFTPGQFVMVNGYLWRLFQPVQMLSRLSGQLQQAATSAERIFEILDTQPDIVDDDSPVVLSNMKGDVTFENVTFGYEVDEPVLKDVSLQIKAGEMIGLVGASGSGKTTLINLLCRFYDVARGTIKIDGIPLEDLQIKALRDQIAVVLQEPFLFHATIAENIAYGKPTASREEVIWAARMANAHNFIAEFPEAYDTMLGERGTGLSGGQKQRISIARAILKDPRILILDEATSAVDTETERLIQEAIDRLISGRTTIAIAHRLSTLKNADRVVVMDGGSVVEVGTHEELLSMDGVFRKLVDMQSEIAKRAIV